MSLNMRTPSQFEPGAEISWIYARNLEGAGFESGYPLYALSEFDPMWIIQTLSGPHVFGHLAGKPKLVVIGVRASKKGDPDRICRLPLRIRHLQFYWARDGLYHTFLEGDLEKENPGATWMQGRKKVYGHRVRIMLHANLGSSSVEGYIQIIPVGHNDQLLPPIGEGWRWAASLPDIN